MYSFVSRPVRSKPVIFAAILLAGSAVAGCVTQPDGAPSAALGSRDLAPDEKKVIADAVGRVIKDPASAKFHWAKFPGNAGTGDVNYCAWVNAQERPAGL